MSFKLGQSVVGTHNGRQYPGTIEDHAGDEYSVRTAIWREKKWWRADELEPAEQAIDQILDAVAALNLLHDYQLANLAEFLETELQQKATRF